MKNIYLVHGAEGQAEEGGDGGEREAERPERQQPGQEVDGGVVVSVVQLGCVLSEAAHLG